MPIVLQSVTIKNIMKQSLTQISHILPMQKCMAGCDIRDLSDQELLSIVIGTGTREIDVIDMSNLIMKSFGGLYGILNSGIREMAAKSGLGIKKSIKIHASLEMGRRIRSESNLTVIDSPSKAWKLLLPDIIGLKREEFRCLILNNKNMLLKNCVISVGTISEAIIHPREIFRDAIREAGSAIIVAHNHPSGVLTPSREDISATSRLVEAGKLIGIELLDHVILGENSYLSLKEAGYIQ
jgi:DNA repair protein RadC